MARIGVFVCHCGLNIASTVDVGRVSRTLRDCPGVAFTADYKYMCSDPGQMLIQLAITEHNLDGVVVAACSPAMHESTFRKAAATTGLNPYRVEIANIREQVSWPHQGAPEEATRKAIDTVRTLVEKVRYDEPLTPFKLPIVRRALVVGGGIAGLTAALIIADAGYPVTLVERSDRLGGRMAQLSSLYVNFDDSGDLLAERIAAVSGHPLIQVLTNAEVTGFGGYVGNFTVQVSGLRSQVSGYSNLKPETLKPETLKPAPHTFDVGAVVLATGFDLYARENLPEYGGGRYPDVVDSLQFEAMLREGEVRRPSDGRVPGEVVWVQCAGSRDPSLHRPYCSKICCMVVAKQAIAYRRVVPEGQAYVFYIDIRSQGRGYDEFVQRAMEEFDVVYLRGKVARIVEQDARLEVWGADTLSGKSVRLGADLVVLALAAVPSAGSDALARVVRVATDESGFFSEAHPKLRPVESLTAGIYLAGAAQFPKDIPETVAQASGAAAKVLQLFAQPEMVAEPTVAAVDERLCVGCGLCVPACPYEARALHPWRKLATVNVALCQGCGACAVVCRNKATTVRNLTTGQVLAMMEAVLPMTSGQ
ncbi:MAG TPA: CoB--CoM heterodisulfide reductase iron-sulfur subunit A family protein [Anaerolineae bacterium]|nr:CoB--CoM heterodisulfide reductase iron-sulfur subunit A family protein [Anaerolineae bacterium]